MTACSIGNISAKNYKNRLMYVEAIASQGSVMFGRIWAFDTADMWCIAMEVAKLKLD